MKTLIVFAVLTGALFAECRDPKDVRVRVNTSFKGAAEVSELTFASDVKERLNLIPHVCTAQSTESSSYVVDIAGISIDNQIFAVSVAWGPPGCYVTHTVATFGNDSNQVRDIARLMVEDVADSIKQR